LTEEVDTLHMSSESNPPPITADGLADTALTEINAMRTVHDTLRELPVDARRRVLTWAGSILLSQAGVAPVQIPTLSRTPQPTSETLTETKLEATDLPSFFSKARPEVQTEKALVVAFWLQEYQQIDDLDSQRINTELKHLGHGVSNITRTLEHLMDTKPAMVIQTRKSGSSQQARKSFRVTTEGANRVRSMIEAGGAAAHA
jgi:hypothetical protein